MSVTSVHNRANQIDRVLHAWAEAPGTKRAGIEAKRGAFEHAVALMAGKRGLPTDGLEHRAMRTDGADRRLIEDLEPIDLAMALGRWDDRQHQRKKRGAYYTPASLAGPLVEACVGPLIDRVINGADSHGRLNNQAGRLCDCLRLCDPACGAGNFFLVCLELLDSHLADLRSHDRAVLRRRFVNQCLHGIDVDPVAVRLARLLLWLALGDGRIHPCETAPNIVCDDALLPRHAQWDGMFDALIGNPPFVDSETGCARGDGKSWRRAVSNRYSSARGNWDVSSIFVERGLEMLKPGGRLGFILPRRILGSDHAASVQSVLSRQTIERIDLDEREDAFDGASIGTLRLIVRNSPPGAGHALRVTTFAGRARLIEQQSLRAMPPGHWSVIIADRTRCCRVPIDDIDWIAALLRTWPVLGDVAQVSDGATTSEAYRLRELIVEGDSAGSADHVKLINTGTIDPFITLWGRQATRYLSSRFDRPVVPLDLLKSKMPRRAAQAQRPKILVAGLASRLEAVADEGRALCGKSAVLIVPENPDQVDALTAWLNAGPITDLYRALFGCRSLGKGSLSIGPRQLALLPVPASGRHDGSGSEIMRELREIGTAMRDAELAPSLRRELLSRLDQLVSEALTRSADHASPTSWALVGTR